MEKDISLPAKMARLITATEILAERAALRTELGSVPHGTGRGWSSMLWVSCDCPNCRDEYDPTGEESAKYLNMDPTSFFADQSEMPSFAFSKIAKESYLAHLAPGFYFDERRDVRSSEEFLSQLTPPLAIYPRHSILHFSKDGVWNRFFLSKDGTHWVRRTWKAGRSVWYDEDENPPIPIEISNEALRQALSQL